MSEAAPTGNIAPLIPPWTFADYAEGLAPYEYLYALRNTPVVQRQRMVLAANRAKAVGYGTENFKQTYTNYVKEMTAATGDPYARTTDFSGQEIMLSCGEYACDDQGVTLYGRETGEVVVCTHPILPVRRLINIDTGEVKQELAFRRGKTWRKAIFDKSVLSSAQRIVGLSSRGIGVDTESARDLVRYLSAMENMNYDDLPEARSVGRLGWVAGYGFSPYVDGLVFDGNDQYRHAFESVRAGGSEDKWLAVARRARAGDSLICRMMLAASFASVLVEPLDALPFLVHVWGGAGAGKTVGLMLAASVWARPGIGDYVKSFNGTPVATELQAAFCGSLPLCLDELQCLKDRKSFDDLIYMLCEGAGKARGAKGGGLQRMTSWRNCTISTGEQPITSGNSGAGAVNRVVELNCGSEKLFDDPREVVAILTRNYGHAGKRFVQAIQREEIKELMHATQKAYYDQLIGKATDKQALSASLLLTGDALAELLIFEDGRTLTVEELLPYLTTSAQADANRRAYNWLLDEIAANPQRFSTNNFGEYSGECWGCVEPGRAWIIKGVFDRLMAGEGYSGESLLSWAARNALLDRGGDSNKHRTRMKRMKGQSAPARCVCLVIPRDDGSLLDANGNTVFGMADG